MGLRGTSTMRKPELVATLQAARSGGEAPAGVTVRPVKGAASKPTQQTQPAAQAAQTPEQALKAEPKGSAPVSAADDAVAGLVASLPEPDAASTRTPRISRQKAAECRQQGRPRRGSSPSHPRRCQRRAEVAADLFDELDIAPADDQPRHRDDAADSGNDASSSPCHRTTRARPAERHRPRPRRYSRHASGAERQCGRRSAAPVMTVIIAMTTSANSPAATVATALTVPTAMTAPIAATAAAIAMTVATAVTTVASDRMRGRDRGGRDYDDRDTREVRISDHQRQRRRRSRAGRRHRRRARLLRLRAHFRLPARPERRVRLHGPGQEVRPAQGRRRAPAPSARRARATAATSARSSCRCSPSTPSTA